jgi:Periplasmic binding protein-like domain
VFCANDMLALGLLRRLSLAGVTVPGDLAVVGYDDIEFAADAAVPLTSVRQPKYQLGSAAAELLLDEADRPGEHEHRRFVFKPESGGAGQQRRLYRRGLQSGPFASQSASHAASLRRTISWWVSPPDASTVTAAAMTASTRAS